MSTKCTTTWDDIMHPGNAGDFFLRNKFPPFKPDAAGYSSSNALWLAELSRLVYRHDVEEDDPAPQPARTRFLLDAGLMQRRFFISQAGSTQAMLVEHVGDSPYAALVFRGTEQSLDDYIANLKLGTLPFRKIGICIHKGFEESLDSIWSEIEAELDGLKCPVFFSGHSLGAALATLAASRRRPRAVYTFGSPRVGNQAFVDSLADVTIYRIVDDQDIVTTVPPEIMGFRHVGEEHRLASLQSGFRQSGFSLLHPFNPPKPFADHAPINYLDRLENMGHRSGIIP